MAFKKHMYIHNIAYAPRSTKAKAYHILINKASEINMRTQNAGVKLWEIEWQSSGWRGAWWERETQGNGVRFLLFIACCYGWGSRKVCNTVPATDVAARAATR